MEGSTANAVSSVYGEFRDRLIKALARHGRSAPIPKLKSFTWRTDVVTSSDTDLSPQAPVFHVGLNFDSSSVAMGSKNDLSFTLTHDQITHFASSLREACKAVDSNKA